MESGGESAAAASLRHSIETGKSAVSSFEWPTTSALAQVTLMRRNYAPSQPVLDSVLTM